MAENRLEVKRQLNEWCAWFGNHVSKTIKHKPGEAFNTSKGKNTGLHENAKKILKGGVKKWNKKTRQTRLKHKDKMRVLSVTIVRFKTNSVEKRKIVSMKQYPVSEDVCKAIGYWYWLEISAKQSFFHLKIIVKRLRNHYGIFPWWLWQMVPGMRWFQIFTSKFYGNRKLPQRHCRKIILYLNG